MAEPMAIADIAGLVSYAEEHLARFGSNLNEAIVTSDVEAIHDLRVASRRVHEALSLMVPWVARKRAKRQQRTLKRVRSGFRKVRDIDVFSISLSESCASGTLGAEELGYLEPILRRRRDRALARAKGVVDQCRPTHEIACMSELIQEFGRQAANGPGEVAKRLQDTLQQRAADVRGKDPRDNDASSLHDTRIRLKRLRYSVQLLQSLHIADVDDLLVQLSSMQTRLGHWNDQVVAVRMLGRLACKRRRLCASAGLCGRLLEYAAARARTAEEDKREVLQGWPALDAAIEAAVGPPEAAVPASAASNGNGGSHDE